jgi:hypothetical protein
MTFNRSGEIFITTKKSIQKLFLIMRIGVLLIIIGCLQLSAKSFSQTITLNVTETPISKVFSAIEKQTGYGFFYRYKDVEQAAPVTLQLTNATLGDALKQCFKNQPFTYVIENKTIVVNKKVPLPQTVVAAAKITVNGVVYDNRHLPLPGVNIRIKGTAAGTVSGNDGKYTITADDDATLVFSFIGLKTREELINKRTEINVTLEEDNTQMSEVVVIGYG